MYSSLFWYFSELPISLRTFLSHCKRFWEIEFLACHFKIIFCLYNIWYSFYLLIPFWTKLHWACNNENNLSTFALWAGKQKKYCAIFFSSLHFFPPSDFSKKCHHNLLQLLTLLIHTSFINFWKQRNSLNNFSSLIFMLRKRKNSIVDSTSDYCNDFSASIQSKTFRFLPEVQSTILINFSVWHENYELLRWILQYFI